MPRVVTRRQTSATTITIVMAAGTRAPAVVVRIAAQSPGADEATVCAARRPRRGAGRQRRHAPLADHDAAARRLGAAPAARTARRHRCSCACSRTCLLYTSPSPRDGLL